MEFLHSLASEIAGLAASPYAVWFLFLIAFVESSFFPIPPDTLLIPLALFNPAFALLYSAVATAGSVLGGGFGYFIGRFGGRPVLNKIAKGEKIDVVKYYYNKYDAWAVGIGAFTPIPYKIFTISAGVFDLDFRRFMLVSFLGRGGRFFLVGLLFFFFGPTIKTFLDSYFEVAIIGFTVLLIGGFFVLNLLGNHARKNISDGSPKET